MEKKMKLIIPNQATKKEAFTHVELFLKELSLKIAEIDDQRPWGGFYVIDSSSEKEFITTFFPEVDQKDIYKYGATLRPKILLVAPGQKLSWQYHNRRAELWKALIGPVGVLISDTDAQPTHVDILNTNEIIELGNQVRHRLIGLDAWGIVAEIWQHTDSQSSSEESDIVRVEDNYGR